LLGSKGHGSAVIRAAAFLILATKEPWAAEGNAADELTVGSLGATSAAPAAPYFSNRLSGSVDASETVSFRIDTILTHYSRTPDRSADNIFQLVLGGTWEPDDHLSIDVDGNISPPSTTTQLTPATAGTPEGRYKERTSSGGAVISGAYDTAGESDLESAIDLTAGVTSYSTTQRQRTGVVGARVSGPSASAALVQWRGAVGVTETLFRNSDVGLVGTYYLYSADPTDTGYYGAQVFGRGAIMDGIPLEPLRYSVRPIFVQRFGDLQLRASFQYGEHVDGAGYGMFGGLKGQYRFSHAVKVWIAGYHGREIDGSGSGENIDWGSVGAMLYF
jgi:hypothetical protein